MEARDLRIGNFVNLKDKGGYRISGGHDIEELEDWDDTDYYSGIPINEEWLLRFGFEKDGYDWVIDSNIKVVKYVVDIKHDFYVGVKRNNVINAFAWNIQHVHQLQNLYFALTGQELNLNPLIPLP